MDNGFDKIRNYISRTNISSLAILLNMVIIVVGGYFNSAFSIPTQDIVHFSAVVNNGVLYKIPSQLMWYIWLNYTSKVFASTTYSTSCNGSRDFANWNSNTRSNQCYIDCQYGWVWYLYGTSYDNPDQFCIWSLCLWWWTSDVPWPRWWFISSWDPQWSFSFGPNPVGISMNVITARWSNLWNLYGNDVRNASINVTCNDAPALPCYFNWQEISHWQSITAYQSSNVACGQSCVSETRTCNNWVLDGNYTNSSCTVDACINWVCDNSSRWWCTAWDQWSLTNNWCGQTDTWYCNSPNWWSNAINCSKANDACIINGCTNSSACNYNAFANSDDGSCIVPGGTCTSAQNSCGQSNGGNYICNSSNNGLTCNAVTPSNPANYSQSCSKISSQNSCGASNTTYGTYQCNGDCDASTPSIPLNPTNYGNNCSIVSNANSCNMTNTNYGTINCNSSCTAGVPSTPSESLCCVSNAGQFCSKISSQNSCGASNTTYGTYQCNGDCDASTPSIPSNPTNYGNNCSIVSNANSCNMTNTNYGTIDCNSNCTASVPSTPSESLCAVNATCGSANGVSTYITPSVNLCGAGNGINWPVLWPAVNTYTWICNWSNGWSAINCFSPQIVDCIWSRWSCSTSCGWGSQNYNITSPAINWWASCSAFQWQSQSCNTQPCVWDGVCGSSSGQYLWSIPTNNLCAIWNTSLVIPMNNMYIWSCASTNWWGTSDCIAYTDPICGSTAWSCVWWLSDTDNFATCGIRTWNCTNETKTISCTKNVWVCCVATAGNTCTSTANSCGITATGTVACNGVCNAVTPANPATYGNSCNNISTANSCGAINTTTGSVTCGGLCNAAAPTIPANPATYGNSCNKVSITNACGITNTTTGIIACDTSCNATAPTVPLDSLCTFVCQWSVPVNHILCTNNAIPTSNIPYSLSADSCASVWSCKYRAQTCSELGNCPVAATCGIANGTSTYTTPSTNLCSAGNGISWSVSWPIANTYNWICAGINWWASANCSASQNIDCVWSFWSCSLPCGWGTQTYSITTPASNSGNACSVAQWQSQACNIQACASNGVCGSASGAVSSNIPTTNLCAGWSVWVVMIIWNNYSWTCAWTVWWNSPVCVSYMSPICDLTNAWSCILGATWSDNSVSCGTRTWTCSNAGQIISCSKSLTACTYNCTGIPPANSTLCANSDQWLTGNTSVLLAWACTVNILPGNTNKCEYVCGNWYSYDNLTQTCKPIILTNNFINWKVYISGTTIAIQSVSTYLYSGAVIMSGVSWWVIDGKYMFTWLLAGSYTVSIRLPDGYDGLKNSTLLNLVGNSYLFYDFPLRHCGSTNELPCTDNNCQNPICINWCDAWLVVVWGLCVSPIGQLIVTKTSISSGTIWSQITYKLSIQNNKNTIVTNAMILDNLPSSLTYVSSQPSANVNWNTIYRNGITLLPWATGEYIINAIINSNTASIITNIWYVGTGTIPADFTTWWSSTTNNPVIFQNNIRWLVYISGTNLPITGVSVSLYSWTSNISWFTSNNTWYIFSWLNNWIYSLSISIPAWYTGVESSNNLNLAGNTWLIYDFPLTPCGASGQIACDINNCWLSPCNLWCNVWLILSGNMCIPPVAANYITWNIYISGTNTIITWFAINLSWVSIKINTITWFIFGPLNNGIYIVSSNKSGYNISAPILSSLTGNMTWYARFDAQKCGWLDEIYCIVNNCQNSVCVNGCDVWLTNINGVCKKLSDPIIPNTPGWSSKHMYCRNAQELYIYDGEAKTTDIAWICPTPTTKFITICRNSKNIKVIKDYSYLKWFVQAGDGLWPCLAKVEIIDVKKYLDLYHDAAPVVLQNKTTLPTTGISSSKPQESQRN